MTVEPQEEPQDSPQVFVKGPGIEALQVLVKAIDEKFTLLLAEAEKRNGQRFDAQQNAILTALNASEKAVNAAMSSAEKAVSKAEVAAEKRFESVNEFRKTLSDQTSTFLTRNEYMVQHAALSEKVDVLSNRVIVNEKGINEAKDRSSGRNDIWLIIVAVMSVLVPVIMHFVFKGIS